MTREQRSAQDPGTNKEGAQYFLYSATISEGLTPDDRQTITVKIAGSDHHLICYYTQDDIRSGRLHRPTAVPELMALEIPHELIQSTNFRYPPKLEPGPDGRLTRMYV